MGTRAFGRSRRPCTGDGDAVYQARGGRAPSRGRRAVEAPQEKNGPIVRPGAQVPGFQLSCSSQMPPMLRSNGSRWVVKVHNGGRGTDAVTLPTRGGAGRRCIMSSSISTTGQWPENVAFVCPLCGKEHRQGSGNGRCPLRSRIRLSMCGRPWRPPPVPGGAWPWLRLETGGPGDAPRERRRLSLATSQVVKLLSTLYGVR